MSRTQRRVLRTKSTIQDAFVGLVLERGYRNVSVEDIVAKADVAKATFYAHFPNKEELLSAVFNRLIEDAADRMAYRVGPWMEIRRGAVEASYRHAAEVPDVYKVCLSDPSTRARYTDTLTRFAERNFQDRMEGLGREPRVPVFLAARVMAGAHVAVLESWLAGDIDCSVHEVARMELDVLIAGLAWAQNISLEELGYRTAGAKTDIPEAGGETQD